MPKEISKILIFSLPALGDVLLSTPLIRSLRLFYPNAQIDVMIREGTQAMLVGNTDINNILTCQKFTAVKDYLEMFKATAFKYDLSFSTSASDRAFWCLFFASQERYFLSKKFKIQDFWKFLGTHHLVDDNHEIHVVQRNLKLLDFLKIPKFKNLIPPTTEFKNHPNLDSYIVIHPYPRKNFKLWNIASWQKIIKFLEEKNFKIVLSGGNDPEEINYLKQLATEATIINAGKLSLPETAEMLKQAKLLIGVDTGTTHLASAVGIPVIALFGPTSPVRWSPWPTNYEKEEPPFTDQTGSQTANNVTIIRASCCCLLNNTSCHQRESIQSLCMKNLGTEDVIKTIKNVLSL